MVKARYYNLFSVIAWLIIPINFTYVSEMFYFKSWNLFVAICALPSIMLGLWLFAFPESPKFLLECGETDAALEVFKWIYAQNTKADPDTYPVRIVSVFFCFFCRNYNKTKYIFRRHVFSVYRVSGQVPAGEDKGQKH